MTDDEATAMRILVVTRRRVADGEASAYDLLDAERRLAEARERARRHAESDRIAHTDERRCGFVDSTFGWRCQLIPHTSVDDDPDDGTPHFVIDPNLDESDPR